MLANCLVSLTHADRYAPWVAGIRKAAGRVGIALVALMAGLGLFGVPTAAGDSTTYPELSSEGSSQTRIVNGKTTSISEWPWQVALLDRRFGSSGRPTSQYFCSGSLIAPTLVVTAAHCVADYRPDTVSAMTVVAGRTYLNRTSSGETLSVARVIMPLDSDGRRKYRIRAGAAIWDVALVELTSASTSPPVAIAGQSEEAAWQPGRLVRTSGWGYTGGIGGTVSNRLRVARQVILPDSVCRNDDGNYYRPETMICLGGPEGGSTACSGDSGGPLVSPVSGGWRLVGLTSFGDFFCRGNIPSVDNRTAADPVREWIRKSAIEVSGYDPVTEGGEIGPLPSFCRVPGLVRKTRDSARRALRSAGCRLRAVRLTGRPSGGKRRVVSSSLPGGWLAPRGFGITILLRR